MYQNAVIRVYATTQEPDYDLPWQSDPPYQATGSGVVIAPRQVLTGAHVVANATFVQVQKFANPDKLVARVVQVCHDCDLALLEVDDPTFMDGVQPCRLGELSAPGDHISVVGFPVGGDEMSITEGVVSRIEVSQYSHSKRRLLTVTVDAAINSGNSGGPVFRGDEVVGIAFQVLEDAENIGELVPSPLVKRFVDGIENGRPLAIPDLGIEYQHLENPSLRTAVGMVAGESGVLITGVRYGSTAWGHLQKGDVLLTVAGHDIANNATVSFRGRFRTGIEAVLGEQFIGDTIELTLLRDGERSTLSAELQPFTALVPTWQYDSRPTYFVFAGLVFQVLTLDYLATWKEWWNHAPKGLLYHYYFGLRSEERREIIVLADVLNDAINVGYSDFVEETILRVNGTVPRDLEHLAEIIDAAETTVDLTTSVNHRIVLDVAAARAVHSDILERYDVQSDRSSDLS